MKNLEKHIETGRWPTNFREKFLTSRHLSDIQKTWSDPKSLCFASNKLGNEKDSKEIEKVIFFNSFFKRVCNNKDFPELLYKKI